jgi:ribosomal protein S20
LNRSKLDRLDGMFGLKRAAVERKLRSEVRTAIEGVRRRIESGDPP